MSHTIGQVEQDNPQSDPDALQDLKSTEEQASAEAQNLADKDYEFLFNQLLEGISHGWHDQRIIKFFEQLGDRGTQEDWVAWLERLRPKVLNLPIQSKRQLGTMMIRLGELSRSTEKISKIGATSNRLGRELLFGDAGDIIWEYAGPDLIENVVNTAIRDGEETSPSLAVKVETEEEISNRLPTEFSALSSSETEETTKNSPESTAEISGVSTPSSAIDAPVANSDVLKDKDLQESSPTTEQPLASTEFEQSTQIVSEETVLDSEEFEFELSEPTSAPVVKKVIKVKFDHDAVPNSQAQESITTNQQKPELLKELVETLSESTSNSQAQESITTSQQKLELLKELVETLSESTSNSQAQESVTTSQQKPELLKESVESLSESTSNSQAQEPVTTSQQKPELLKESVESLSESTSNSQAQEPVTTSQQKSALLKELVESLSESTSDSQVQEPVTTSQQKPELLKELVESSEKLASKPQEEDFSAKELPSSRTEQESPESVSLQQVMSLIQQDEELASAISQKLNISRDKLAIETSKPALAEQQDSSSLELIESWFNLGLKQVSAGEFTRAIASWEKALKINPNLSEAWHNRGSALGRLGKYPEAVESFQNALAIDPNNYQAWNDYAHALYQLQQWAEAVRGWNRALKIMPANHLFWYNRGCALEQLEEWAEAIVSYEKSLEIKPDFQPARSRYINLVADNSQTN